MFDNNGLPDARMVPWSRLEPGMVFIDGLTINGSLPDEFRDFPVLDTFLIDGVHRKYRLHKDRPVRVLTPGSDSISPRECTDAVRDTSEKLKVFNGFRQKVGGNYQDFGVPPLSALQSKLVRNDSLIYPWGRSPRRPSLFNHIDHAVNMLTKTVAVE